MPDSPGPITVAISSAKENYRFTKIFVSYLKTIPTFIRVLNASDYALNRRSQYVHDLRDCNIFVLVIGGSYDDKNQDQFLELGAFVSNKDERSKVYVIAEDVHSVPNLLTDFAVTVMSTTDGLLKFLADLSSTLTKQRYDTDDKIRPILPYATELSREFVGKTVRQSFFPLIRVYLNKQSTDEKSIGETKAIATPNALNLLNLIDGEYTLNQIVEQPRNADWGRELLDNLIALVQNRLPSPVRYLLHAEGGAYIPTIYEIERGVGSGIGVKVALVLCGTAFNKWQEELGPQHYNNALFGPPSPSESWPDVFVAMPFSKELDPIYDDHIAPLVRNINLTVGRADNFYTNHAIMSDVWSAIVASRLVIADCTGRNANVFYELGIAHSLGKPTILISQDINDIPFDVKYLRTIPYRYTSEGMDKFTSVLSSTLKSTIADDS